MTLKELLDKVSELCNEDTKDLEVKLMVDGDTVPVFEIWHYRLKNDYVEINEVRVA